MEQIEIVGKTVEDAKQEALRRLKTDNPEYIDYEVVEEGSAGILGMGAKEAKIKVSMKPEFFAVKAEKLLQDILGMMGIEARQAMKDNGEEGLKIDLEGEDLALLIGARGSTLDSLQLLVNVIINRGMEGRKRIIIDANGYKEKRERMIADMALREAERVRQEKRHIILEPMPPNERRIIHLALKDHPYVTTYSSGEEPLRKIVITPREE